MQVLRLIIQILLKKTHKLFSLMISRASMLVSVIFQRWQVLYEAILPISRYRVRGIQSSSEENFVCFLICDGTGPPLIEFYE